MRRSIISSIALLALLVGCASTQFKAYEGRGNVVEGNGGNMRAGLPWQSVHDGENFVHEPLRLTVAVEAPKEAISDILKRHAQVRALFDNGWLHLFTLDEQGQMANLSQQSSREQAGTTSLGALLRAKLDNNG